MPSRNFASWLRAYMELTAETESPDIFHFWSGVTVLGGATKRQLKFELGPFDIYPNFYTILVGPSGARKTAATSIAMALAQEAGLRKFSEKITAAALIKDLAESAEKHVYGNTIQVTSPLIIYSAELGVFLGTDAYGTGIISDLTDLYDCPPKWEKKTISRGTEVVLGPFVSLLAASTPQTLKDVIPPASVGQGFTSRIMFVWGGGRKKRIPFPKWTQDHVEFAGKLVEDLKHISSLQGKFTFTPAASRAFEEHYNSRPEPEEEYEDERLRGYASRKDIHTLKLAMAMSIAESDSLEITDLHIEAAIEGLNFIDSILPNVFSSMGTSATVDDLQRILRQVEVETKRYGYCAYPSIVRRNYHNLNSSEVDVVIRTLVEGGAISEEYRQLGGRMTRCYVLKDPNFVLALGRRS